MNDINIEMKDKVEISKHLYRHFIYCYDMNNEITLEVYLANNEEINTLEKLKQLMVKLNAIDSSTGIYQHSKAIPCGGYCNANIKRSIVDSIYYNSANDILVICYFDISNSYTNYSYLELAFDFGRVSDTITKIY